MSNDRLKFITFEGIEGCGKSTQSTRFARYLLDQGVDCLHTKQPGGTDIGRMIRAILLHPDHEGMHPWCESLLYLADRCQHVHEVIRPALAAGRSVVCDRYQDSTVAYQGGARQIAESQLDQIFMAVTGGLKPDLTVLLDIDEELGLDRALQRNHAENIHATEGRFEAEKLAFHRIVRSGFLDLAHQEKDRFLVIDGSGSLDEVHARIVSAFHGFRAAQSV